MEAVRLRAGFRRRGLAMSLAASEPVVLSGCCHVYYALDIGYAVDLKRCAGLLEESREGAGFQHHARTPSYLNLRPPPIHVSQSMPPIGGRSFRAQETVTTAIYDFGAVSVEYRIPFKGTLDELAELSSELYDNRQFAADARSRAAALLRAIGPAVKRPTLREEAEDYLIFEIPSLGEPAADPERFFTDNAPLLARVLSSNTRPLASLQQQEELSGRIAYYANDLTFITWNAALIFGKNMEDVLAVLELANVQLRELHYLDDELDDRLQESYDIRAKAAGVKSRMRRIRELMLDGQAFNEAVTNAFKPFPDAFLARVYAIASRSLGLRHCGQSVKDKLSLLNTLYTTLSDEADHERSMRLEWIVIILILIEIFMGLSDKLLPWIHR